MGGKSSTTTSKVSIPPEVLARYNAVNARAETAAATPYQAFGKTASDYVAQMNAQQNAGINDINTTAGSYQPYMDKATTATQAGMGPAYEGINNYMSPYIKNVADTTGALMKQQYEQAQSGALGTAAMSGAFGGDRAGIAAANMQQQNQLGYGSTMANIMNQGYTQALGASQADLARQLQGGSQMAALGAQSQQLGLQGAQAKIAAGTMQQQTEQAGKDAMIKTFMQEKGYPFQTAQFLANIAMGTGANSGSATSTTQPMGFFGNLFADGGKVNGYADGGGVAGPMTSAMSAFGDEGYVPAASLPVGRLMIADPPEQQKRGGADDIMKIVQLVASMANGGVAGGRHGYATDGSVTDPKGESQGEYIGRVTDPYYHFLTQTAPHAALGLGARIASLAPKAASVVAGALKHPETSTMLDQAASDLYDYGLRTSAKGLEYRDPTLPAPLSGQAALDLGKTTPQQDAAREAFMRQNMDLEPSRVGPDGYTPSDYGAAMLRGPNAAGWTLGTGPRVSVMTPNGVAGRPDVDVGSMPAAPQRVYGRPDVPMIGSMPKYDAPPETYGRPEVNVGSMPARPQSRFDMPVGSMPILRPPRRPEGLGYMPTMPVGGPDMTPEGLLPASLAPLTSPRPPPRPVDLGTPIIPTEEGAAIAKATAATLRQPPAATEADTHSLYTQGIRPIEAGLGPNGEPLVGAAGEIGASQMLPSTGPEAARLAGLPWDAERFKNDTKYNDALGEAYYANLLKMFGDPLKAAAAYNAGMGRLGSAIDAARNYGGTWMDHIPASTQAYVKKFAVNIGQTAPATSDGLAAARVAPAADVTGGLGNADMTQRQPNDPLRINKPYDERNMIGQFFHNKDDGRLNKNAIMSVLAGLGSMANSNSVFPLTAMLQGVAGGSEAYKQLEKQAADIAQTEATTRQTDVVTATNRFFTVGQGGMPMVVVPGKGPVMLDDFLSNPEYQNWGNPAEEAMVMEEAQRKAASGQIPASDTSAPASTTAPAGVFSLPVVRDYIQGETDLGSINYADAQARTTDVVNSINDLASVARASRASNLMQAEAIANLSSGNATVSSGALNKLQITALAYANSILDRFGYARIDGVDDAQLAQKAAIIASIDRAHGGGQDSYDALMAALSANPSAENEPDTNAKIMSSLMLAQQRSIDLASFTRAYRMDPANKFKLAGDAASAYDEVYRTKNLAEEKALEILIRHGSEDVGNGIEVPMKLIMDPSISAADKNEVIMATLSAYGMTQDQIAAMQDQNGQINMARYFGG